MVAWYSVVRASGDTSTVAAVAGPCGSSSELLPHDAEIFKHAANDAIKSKNRIAFFMVSLSIDIIGVNFDIHKINHINLKGYRLHDKGKHYLRQSSDL